jgi:hypothetical protein
MTDQQFPISKLIRIVAATLGSVFLLMVPFLVVTGVSEYWYATVACLITGAIFLYAAIKGQSPAFLEDPLWLAKNLARHRQNRK